MKKVMAMVMALVMAAGMTACGSVSEAAATAAKNNTSDVLIADDKGETDKQEEDSNKDSIDGGWSISEDNAIDKNPEANAALEKALEGMVGAVYEPVAVLGTQVVAGTNYCILCKVTAVTPDAQPTYALVYVYEDFEGSAEITDVKDIILGETGDDYADAGEESADADLMTIIQAFQNIGFCLVENFLYLLVIAENLPIINYFFSPVWAAKFTSKSSPCRVRYKNVKMYLFNAGKTAGD